MSTETLQDLRAQQLAQLAAKAEVALVWTEAGQPVASPCINVCRMTEDRSHCQGCFRTIDDIRAWSKADSELRLQIWGRLLQRAGLDDPRTH
ncbi:DUF1289 domain-containing protein [Comamonas guangdongensis]|uniref:DUF1289 domain-containing protein n=1 Tax=Comamonas guangdongensis TaxID=510515 RepID=A0ABV3ZZ52_9BURK